MWNEIVENIKIFFNQPVAIIGCSVGFLLVFVLVLCAKTSLGKKALNFLKKGFNDLVVSFNTHKQETENKIGELKSYYENELKNIEAENSLLKDLIVFIADESHNHKIKDYVSQCKDKLLKVKSDYTLLVEEKINEVKKEAEDYKQVLAKEYETQLGIYKDEFEKLIEEAKKVAENAQNTANSINDEIKESVEELKEEIIEELPVEEIKNGIEEFNSNTAKEEIPEN